MAWYGAMAKESVRHSRCPTDTTLRSFDYHDCWIRCTAWHGAMAKESVRHKWYHFNMIWLSLLPDQVHGIIWGHGQRISETWLMSNDTILASSDYHYCQIRCTAQYEAKKNQQDKADAQMILTSWAATFGCISQNTGRLRSRDHKRSWKMGVMGGGAGCCINPFPAKKTVLLS